MLPVWSDEFSVNHEIIDQHHQVLFELAHKAYKIANSHALELEVKAIIRDFFDYMKMHFKDEERYMEAIGYPQLEQHRKFHREILEEMAGMVKNVSSVYVMKQMMLSISKDWLLNHILHEDVLISKYCTKKFQKRETCELKYYYYTCACEGKEHRLTEAVHIFVKNSSNPVDCKECHQKIHFKEERIGNA